MLRLPNKLFILLLFVIPSFAWALPSDREQQIDIEADHAQIDDSRGITQYKGRAILTQGTLKVEGDIITFYYDENKELTKIIAQGNLAKYQQVQKPGEAPVKARALQMEYYAQKQMLYLVGKGHIKQNSDEFSGARIEYDLDKNIINASSTPAKSNGKPQEKQRIHIIIQPTSTKKKLTTNSTGTNLKAAIEPIALDAEQVKGYKTATATTTLNIRTGPGTQYNKLGVLYSGSSVYILTEQNKWVQVRGASEGQPSVGWVSRSYLTENN